MRSFKLTSIVYLMIVLHTVQILANDFDIKFGLTKKVSAGIRTRPGSHSD
jgi:hypothetical protein